MKYRNLRIAWSVAGLTTFVSLIGLWLLEYQRTVIVLLGGIMLATPWIRHIKVRFSLRSLLIATTLVAAILGTIVALSR